VVNGGGSLEREYAVGSGRLVTLIRTSAPEAGEKLSLWYDHLTLRSQTITFAPSNSITNYR
jgi:hypothetical protein